jgi:DNA/RNA endonuclease G (NUC1)
MRTIKSIAICFALFTATAFAQEIDIKTAIFTAHFSQDLREPLYVTYELYKGGGDCSRAAFHFVNDRPNVKAENAKDYAASGYDEGHMANAEDFAGDCTKEKMTFVFYNALPQTPNLNRGIWKHWETLIREWSQTKHLKIICGGYAFAKVKALNVPAMCFKIVQDEDTGKILFCGIFSNNEQAKETDISEPDLEKITGYSLPVSFITQ